MNPEEITFRRFPTNKDLIRYLKSRRSTVMLEAAERLIELDNSLNMMFRRNTALEAALREILNAETKVREIERNVYDIAREALE